MSALKAAFTLVALSALAALRSLLVSEEAHYSNRGVNEFIIEVNGKTEGGTGSFKGGEVKSPATEVNSPATEAFKKAAKMRQRHRKAAKKAAEAAASAVEVAQAAQGEEAEANWVWKKQMGVPVFISGVPVYDYSSGRRMASGRRIASGRRMANDSGSASAIEVVMKPDREWIVVMKPGGSDSAVDSLCKEGGCSLRGHPEKGGVDFATLTGSEDRLEAALKAASGRVEFVEVDSRLQLTPELEGKATKQWNLDKIGISQTTRTGKGVNVYVLDSGLRTSHSDFEGRAFSAFDLTSGSMEECPDQKTCTHDKLGHGTHCAGTVAGASFGAAPGAKVFGGKLADDDMEFSMSRALAALDWCATERAAGPAVVSMSWGGPKGEFGPALILAIEVMVDSGAVAVVAAGNENSDACKTSPAFMPAVITVGSTTERNARAKTSSWGECVDIWAPGTNIISASHENDDGSLSKSGTSMACPLVAGAAALVLQESPTFSPAEVRAELLETAIKDSIEFLMPGDTNAILWMGKTKTKKTCQETLATCETDCKADFEAEKAEMYWVAQERYWVAQDDCLSNYSTCRKALIVAEMVAKRRKLNVDVSRRGHVESADSSNGK